MSGCCWPGPIVRAGGRAGHAETCREVDVEIHQESLEVVFLTQKFQTTLEVRDARRTLPPPLPPPRSSVVYVVSLFRKKLWEV